MSDLKSLRERVAQALYENTHVEVRPWDELPDDRRLGWLSDADVVIPVVVAACCRVVDQTDPDKPSAYLFRRERLSSALEGLFNGWTCPMDEPGCTSDCGSCAAE